MTEEWKEKLSSVRDHAEQVLNEVEVKEFQTRIAVMMQELDDKNREIEVVNDQKRQIEETVDKAMEMNVDLRD